MKTTLTKITALLYQLEASTNDDELIENLNDALISLESAIARLNEIDQALETEVNAIKPE